MSDFDGVVQDGKAVANKGMSVLVGLGGVLAGIGLAASDLGTDLVQKLMDLIDIDNALIANALMLLIGIIALAVVLSLRTMVSTKILVHLFTFFAVMLATYLIVKVIAVVIGFLRGEPVAEGA